MKIRLLGLGVLLGVLLGIAAPDVRGQINEGAQLPQPYLYGNILINRTSEKNKVKPVTFSHWIHRQKHTCRVCHFELKFKFKVNTTEITEQANREGRFCGAAGCHDGKTVFGHTKKEDCEKCHNGDISYGKEKFEEVRKKLPPAKYGNGIDWTMALAKGLIKPLNILSIKPPPDLKMVKLLRFKGDWNVPLPAVIFSHKRHSEWLDCNNCHPDLFPLPVEKKGAKDSEKDMEKDGEKDPGNDVEKKPGKDDAKESDKKKAEKKAPRKLESHLPEKNRMPAISRGESCGLCHLRVAFPINDCGHCHPGMGEY